MSEYIFNRAQSRRVDQIAIEQCGMSGLVLMENAGRSLADLIERLGIDGTVVICCGHGNNGGDGFVLARHLANRGYGVRVCHWTDRSELSGDALANYEILTHCRVPLYQVTDGDDATPLFRSADWLVDALLGTGAQGEPRPPYAAAIEQMNAIGSRILAVDLPSGLDCDTGIAVKSCVRAAHTGTFVTSKVGFAPLKAMAFVGEVHVLDIGVPRSVIEQIASVSTT